MVNVVNARDLGASLREARVRAGLTQQQAADAAGVGRRFVVIVEGGHERAELGKVLRLAAAVGLRLDAGPSRGDASSEREFDLDQLLDEHRATPRERADG
jgi:HTH-type transcriptional regulator/antitoxin HipB